MKTKIKKIAFGITLLTANSIFAQDVVNVGINDENISVTAPELNHKVSITIEDSTFNYQIDIIKLPKGVTYTGMSMNSDSKHGKKQKKFTSKFFDEVGLGYTNVLPQQIYTPSYIWTSWTLPSTFTYTRRSFLPDAENGGFYANLNIRKKERLFGKSKNFYYHNATNIHFAQQFFYGKMEYRLYENIENRSTDSLLLHTDIKADIALSNLYIGKKLALGYKINRIKGLSVEYGLDIAVRLFNKENVNLYNTEAWLNDVPIYKDKYDIYLSNLFNPGVTIMNRLGVNYKRYSFNYGYSMGTRYFGSDTEISGHAQSIGFAFRFR
ncbi:MAG: hypothetical protein H6607_08975 [Flavobacteriales bacterium]|nr:hypothetical protein [Flavobacteriales bacterium]